MIYMRNFSAPTFIRSHRTLICYFLSYFAILCFLFVGFYFIMQSQLKQIYFTRLNEDVDRRLTIAEEQLKSNLYSIEQIHSLLTKDILLATYRYFGSDYDRVELFHKLRGYTAGNSFIDSIVYLDRTKNDIISSNRNVRCDEDSCIIASTSTVAEYTAFPMSYLENVENSTLYVADGSSLAYFIYVPACTNSQYQLFYIIDTMELNNTLKNNIISGIYSIAIVDNVSLKSYGVNTQMLPLLTQKMLQQNGMCPVDDNDSLYIHTWDYGTYSLVALFSHTYFYEQVHNTFRVSYILLFAIGILGFILVWLCTSYTYLPLHKFTQKIIGHPHSSAGYIEQLDQAFSDTLQEKANLQDKIDMYHQSIQESLLNSILTENNTPQISSISRIDQIFRPDCKNHIFLLRIQSDYKPFPHIKVVKFLENSLPGRDTCVTLEKGADYGVFIINYIGQENDKEEVIHMLMNDLNCETGYYCAISNVTSSLLDIPSLYENTMVASSYWSTSPVVSYSEVSSSKKDTPVYPYKLLNQFNDSLKNQDFKDTQAQLKKLLELTNQSAGCLSEYPDFFVRSVLIDILTSIVNSMNQNNVRFRAYSELYFETLYFCRSCSYAEKKEKLSEHMLRLLDIYQTELENNAIHSRQMKEFVEAKYSSPDLSVAMMADYFHVSIAYMSYLFKKKFGENFIDYLWKIRYEKAMELLQDTDMPIDDIAVSVGYTNVSSFRRKFKQETGMTPSAVRTRSVMEKAE